MAERSRVKTGRVLRTEQLAPHMIRVVLGGEGLDGFEVGPYTDSYVKLQFPQEDVHYPEPFDLGVIRETLPRDQWPRTRTYTVRRWGDGELWIDFVVHGDEGIAGPWAAKAQPGDLLWFSGPGGGYAPDATADWHLMAGDESALPAIAAAVEALPPGAHVRAFVEVDGPDEELPLPGVEWVHRSGRHGQAAVDAVRGLEFPAGRVHVFVHGEAHMVKELRGHLRNERGLGRDQLSISGYWRLGADEDGWQSGKAEWNRQVEQEQETA
ncbi:siderophore-interacting protein [Saccharothrix violaceirubra]|uniref:NADPH-dependent ferric siderophore reductase n=1 Tax=Saccharothrix violaceirubra TaxID=413306 RepID=A0A7W7WY72_9PSEU|nr:siderophore-interacting protein [Saccharothrix violaceirubra]MBB4967907.1 NADPH-dependent ferric siderophore reductase [Saccharothrix violaceirubra]